MLDGIREVCPVRDPGGVECGEPSLARAPFLICPRHAAELYRFVADTFSVKFDDFDRLTARVTDEASRPRWTERGHWVYYVQIGRYIKIGKSTSLNSRMRNFPPGARLLAVEPGDRAVELVRLGQFEHLREARREWFRPGPDLLDHIERLRSTSNVWTRTAD